MPYELDELDENDGRDCIHWTSKQNVFVILVAFFLFEVYDDNDDVDEVWFVVIMSHFVALFLEDDEMVESDDKVEWFKSLQMKFLKDEQ